MFLLDQSFVWGLCKTRMWRADGGRRTTDNEKQVKELQVNFAKLKNVNIFAIFETLQTSNEFPNILQQIVMSFLLLFY